MCAELQIYDPAQVTQPMVRWKLESVPCTVHDVPNNAVWIEGISKKNYRNQKTEERKYCSAFGTKKWLIPFLRNTVARCSFRRKRKSTLISGFPFLCARRRLHGMRERAKSAAMEHTPEAVARRRLAGHQSRPGGLRSKLCRGHKLLNAR
ncbi:hypothetical protein BS78_03G225700 [Paspalum vaginatum]|nr:hypothetical protein BS78_03G225700 [Paspalum vaginatum]